MARRRRGWRRPWWYDEAAVTTGRRGVPLGSDANDDLGPIPDGATPVIAYRWWDTRADGAIRSLRSLGDWVVGEWFHAYCQCGPGMWQPNYVPPHPAPAEGCFCGVYAYKTAVRVSESLEGMKYETSRNLGFKSATGVVELAGKVIEHELGYRAERARIVSILPVQWELLPFSSHPSAHPYVNRQSTFLEWARENP